jgi:lactoylglutathione lyase
MTEAANVKQAVPFFSVFDMDRSLRFYLDGLGFTMTNKWTPEGAVRWCWLQHGDAAIMLQTFWTEGPHKNVPSTPLGLGVTICFVCQDAIALYHEFAARGIAARRPFVGNGMWVTDVSDPDGYKLYFESKTEAPEDSQYEG